MKSGLASSSGLFSSEMQSSRAMILSAVGFEFPLYPTARTVWDHFLSLRDIPAGVSAHSGDRKHGYCNREWYILQSGDLLRREAELRATFVPPEHGTACATNDGVSWLVAVASSSKAQVSQIWAA